MGNVKLEKSKAYQLVDLHQYVPHSVVIHPIFIKSTGNISVISYDAGVTKEGEKSPFDAFIQVIEGAVEIHINDQSHLLKTGQVLIIPGHSTRKIIARERVKMLSTTIKSGYEDEHI